MTNELKARFFGLYWLQKVLRIPTEDITSYTLQHPYLSETFMADKLGYYLLLKPLSAISDEDAIEVAKIEDKGEHDSFFVERKSNHVFVHKRNIDGGASQAVVTNLYPSMEVADFLRSKSYALPFMGISIEKMTEAGWIKLIKNQNT